jgi:predicted HicB family RNase H-like nuclease
MTQTPIRCVRVSQELWSAVTAKATNEGKSASQIIVEALKEYIK